MKVERVLGNERQVALWLVSGDPSASGTQDRIFIGHENAAPGSLTNAHHVALCWCYDPQMANIVTANEDVLASCRSSEADHEVLACDLVAAGRMRNGVPRCWCRTHQHHWGTKADLERAGADGSARCVGHETLMSYVIDPVDLGLEDYAELGVWCSLPAALTSKGPVPRRHPKVHVHVRDVVGGTKIVDGDYRALLLSHGRTDDLFGDEARISVPIPPPPPRPSNSC